MVELQNALNRYGEASIRNIEASIRSMDIVKVLGKKLLESFEDYIGELDCIRGVPPTGVWHPDGRDYHPEEFRFDHQRGPLSVGPISMGVALRIPHTKDKGALWMRVVIEFVIEGNTWSATVGDGKTIHALPIDTAESDLLPVNEEIFDYVKNIFLNPVRYCEAEKAEKIGFVRF
jgi:hypothetical protein